MRAVSDYEVVDQLKAGNHGTFFLAKAPARLGLDDDLVALKVLDRHATDNEFKRMAAELELLLDLRHPFLVEVLDAGHDDGRLFYATRYYPEGGLAIGPTAELASVATIVADVAEAAHALHEVGVAHRDVKPSNILIENGRGFLSDLGVANYLDARFTATGSSPVGTLAYADPELIRGGSPGRASDIWSLGATLHVAVAGSSVLGTIPNDHLAAAIDYVFATDARLAPECPSSVGAIVARATQRHPADRYGTALELAGALRTLAARSGPVPPDPPPAASSDVTPARHAFPVVDGREASAALAPYQQPVFVVGARSPGHHFNRPDAQICRVSGERRGEQRPWVAERARRPALGVLLVDDGTSHIVQWDLVIGRRPDVDQRVSSGRAEAVSFPSDVTMSRAHLAVELGDWEVTVTDLSSNGTRVRSATTNTITLLPPGEPHVLSDGDELLVEARSFTYRSCV